VLTGSCAVLLALPLLSQDYVPAPGYALTREHEGFRMQGQCSQLAPLAPSLTTLSLMHNYISARDWRSICSSLPRLAVSACATRVPVRMPVVLLRGCLLAGAPHHTTPHHTTPHHTTPHHTTPHHTTPHHTAPHHTTPHRTTPRHTTPHRTTPRHATPGAARQPVHGRRTAPHRAR
jgi:hypothetical protein